MAESILGTGVALYFSVRIWLWVRHKSFELAAQKRKISKRGLVFIGVDLAIFAIVIFQLGFSQFGRMDLGVLSEAVRMFGISLFIIGVFLSSAGRIVLGKNWRPAIVSEAIDKGQRLVTSAPFSIIRHPIYSGMILIGVGFELSLLSWFFLAIIPLAFLLYWQAKSEEIALLRAFSEYERYKKNTKMFFPRVL